jgi:hypothetical protein
MGLRLLVVVAAAMTVATVGGQQVLRPVFRGRSSSDLVDPQQLSSAPAAVAAPARPSARQLDCFSSGNQSVTAFELITGYTIGLDDDPATPGQQLADPSVVLKEARLLKLADCLAKCRADKDCRSVNFETGLCVMLRQNADTKRGTYS